MITNTFDSGPGTALAALRPGTWALYAGLASGRSGGGSALLERMSAMGFVPGAELLVEVNHGRGPVIVRIRGARIALGRGQAQQILVEPLHTTNRPGRRKTEPAPLAGAR